MSQHPSSLSLTGSQGARRSAAGHPARNRTATLSNVLLAAYMVVVLGLALLWAGAYAPFSDGITPLTREFQRCPEVKDDAA